MYASIYECVFSFFIVYKFLLEIKFLIFGNVQLWKLCNNRVKGTNICISTALLIQNFKLKMLPHLSYSVSLVMTT